MATYLHKILALWQSDEDDRALDHIRKMGIAVGLGGAGLCAILLMNLLTFNLLDAAWLDGNWRSYWMFAAGPVRFELLLPFITMATSWTTTQATRQPQAQRVRELRQAALRGDDELAPLLRDPPEPFADGTLPAAVEVIPRLRPLVMARAQLMLSAGGFALSFATLLTVCAAFSVASAWSDITLANTYGAPYGMLLGVCLAAFVATIAALFMYGTVLIRRAPYGRGRVARWRGRIDPVVDPWGVRWIFPARPLEEQHISWEDAHAFYQISYRSSADYARHTTYFLDTGDTLLAWKAVSTDWDELIACNERFLRIITTYTGLPLRDLSAATEELARSFVSPKKLTRAEREAARRAARDARQHRPRTPPTPPSVGLVAGSIGALALFVLPVVVGVRVQGMQRTYYDGVAARALAHHPLFMDALAHADGLWPLKGKGPDGGRDPSYAYQDGTYQITGGPAENTLDATLPTVYRDAAIQVTARQRGSSRYDGVGLVVRAVGAGSQESFVAFWVTPNGAWFLERYYGDAASPGGTWTQLASSRDTSSSGSPVHTGLGAANTLLVVIQGNELICYVNGQWVAAARDGSMPATGRVGIYLDDDANTGIFSDFAVYPVAPAA